MTVVPFPAAQASHLRTLNDGEADPAISLTIEIERGRKGHSLHGKDTYRVLVQPADAPEDVLIKIQEHASPAEAAAAVANMLPRAKGQDAQAAIVSHFQSGDAKPIVFQDDGVVFWSRANQMRSVENLGSLAEKLLYPMGSSMAVPVITFPIERWAMGGRVVQELAEIAEVQDEDLFVLHHNASVMRDRAARPNPENAQDMAEAHDRYELSRRAIAAALVATGHVDRAQAASAAKPLRSEAGRALETTTLQRVAAPLRKLRAAIGFER